MEIESVLEALDCQVVGPTAKLETALALVIEEAFDIAILDVTVRGGKIYSLAERLIARGIPFALESGYGDWALPEALREQPRLLKPFTTAELEVQIRLLCGRTASARKRTSGADPAAAASRISIRAR